jgi:NDP-4-keto-2,6-dideoxyhexose 3-C-methyltransferase
MMKKLLDIGELFVSDFVQTQPADRKKYSLDLYLDETTGAVRLHPDALAPHNTMWGTYWYRSGINNSMRRELSSIVREITDRVKLVEGDVWLDIACNDGTLLSNVPKNITRIGIDPCDDSYLEESSKHGTIVQDYFNKENFFKVSEKKAKVITCIAMFYDLNDPHPFIEDMKACLDDNGIIVLQMSYTPLMVEQMAFDNICHEHVYYYDLKSIQRLFGGHGFRLLDASLNDTNGGSFRIYMQKETASPRSFGTAPLRDVCNMRMQGMSELEMWYDISNPEVWADFQIQLNELRSNVVDFIREQRAAGKTVFGYGASTKGNTLLQYFGLTKDDIGALVERSPYKFGLQTIGTDIPIISEEEMRANPPDFMLVLPWHFIDEFLEREQAFLDAGGQFIVPCPAFEVIGKQHD